MFKAVFNSFLFFKTFLTKEATDVMPETDKDILKGISESWKRQLNQNNKDLTSDEDLKNAAKDLYNDILLQNGYKDSSNGDNLKLNHLLMNYIKLRHHVYEHLCRLNNDVQRSDFFKKVFESFFFFKKFLIKIDS